jgi:drug/metabolite transporter (DMT)-like permease
MAVAVAAVSTAAPLVRAADAPTLAVAFWRNMLAVPLTGALVVARDRQAVRDLDRTDRRRSVLAGVLLAAHFGTWLPSLSYTSVASSVALVSTQPVWTALIARRRGEHVAPGVWRGIVLALAGVLLLTGVDFSVEPKALFGDVLALIGGMLAACYTVVGSEVRRTTTTAVYTSICYSVAAAVLVTVCLGARQPLSGYDGGTWLVLLALTIGPQLFGHSMFNLVVKSVGATTVSVAILFEIVGSAVLAWIFFDEAPPLTALPAAALIIGGLVLVVVGHGRSRRDPRASPDSAEPTVDPALDVPGVPNVPGVPDVP